MLKSEQIALFTKSTLSFIYSKKRPWRGKSNNKPLIYLTNIKYHICNKEDY